MNGEFAVGTVGTAFRILVKMMRSLVRGVTVPLTIGVMLFIAQETVHPVIQSCRIVTVTRDRVHLAITSQAGVASTAKGGIEVSNRTQLVVPMDKLRHLLAQEDLDATRRVAGTFHLPCECLYTCDLDKLFFSLVLFIKVTNISSSVGVFLTKYLLGLVRRFPPFLCGSQRQWVI